MRWGRTQRAKPDTAETDAPPAQPPSIVRRGMRGAWRAIKWSLVACLLYLVAVLVGQIPVNGQFRQAADGIEVFVYADLAHSEIIVPRVTEVVDWSGWFAAEDFSDVTGREPCVGFGWGDREFFFETQTWDEAKASVIAGALLWPTDTVMHVSLSARPYEDNEYHRLLLTPEQYAELVEHIQQTFVLNGPNQPQLIPGHGYGLADTFYAAKGTYSLLYTCNNWTGDALKAA